MIGSKHLCIMAAFAWAIGSSAANASIEYNLVVNYDPVYPGGPEITGSISADGNGNLFFGPTDQITVCWPADGWNFSFNTLCTGIAGPGSPADGGLTATASSLSIMDPSTFRPRRIGVSGSRRRFALRRARLVGACRQQRLQRNNRRQWGIQCVGSRNARNRRVRHHPGGAGAGPRAIHDHCLVTVGSGIDGGHARLAATAGRGVTGGAIPDGRLAIWPISDVGAATRPRGTGRLDGKRGQIFSWQKRVLTLFQLPFRP